MWNRERLLSGQTKRSKKIPRWIGQGVRRNWRIVGEFVVICLSSDTRLIGEQALSEDDP